MLNNTLARINKNALLFTIIALLFLSLIRFASLFFFADSHDIQSNISVLDNLFIIGLRFDLRLIGIILLLFIYLPYLFLFWLKNKRYLLYWTRFILSLSLACIVLLAFTDIGYLLFFGTTIDILIFGLIEDDTQAVIASGISDPRLLLIVFTTVLIGALIIIAYLKLSNRNHQNTILPAIFNKHWGLLLIIPVLLVASRGSIDTFPLSQRQSSICTNSFINSLTQNAVFHLNYAYINHQENSFNLSTKEILALAKVANSKELQQKAGFNQQHPLQRHTASSALLESKPPHVVFVLMEGWSAHIALNDSAANPVLGRFKKHAKEDYFLTSFFSNQYGTNPSIENILLNTPITPVSQSSAYKSTFSMSNVLPFKRKGYQTAFIAGGYSSWRNHDAFWPHQGFDHYIDRSIIEKKYQVHADNPWGVYDEYLFRYVQDKLLKADKPTFSFVLTTNNHPPVRLPPEHIPPKFAPEKLGISSDLAHKRTMLAGYHYQTDALGGFVDWLKSSKLKQNVIVVATGDHILKGFANYNSIEKQFLRYAVPAYFYIPEAYNQLNKRTKDEINHLLGSHVDLFPTLFELSLSNASYYAFGSSLMHKTKDNAYGWIDGKAYLVNQGVIDKKTNTLYQWNKQNKMLLETKDYPLLAQHNKIIEQEKYRRWLKLWLLYKDIKITAMQGGQSSLSTND
jgi:phosphoglycerol transferase MdoB-like AlkP superfamily enzyme